MGLSWLPSTVTKTGWQEGWAAWHNGDRALWGALPNVDTGENTWKDGMEGWQYKGQGKDGQL